MTAHHQKFNTEWEDLQMKKKITGSVLSAGAIVLGLAAAGCGGAIENAANGWAMLGYTLLAIVLGCAALALAGLGLVAEQRKEPQKIHKVPENTVNATTMLVSWAAMPCTNHSPMPCQPKIFSTNTAPVTNPPTP